MIASLTNHLWQSTLFVAAAWIVAAALRKNGAHVRHRVWLVASLKFLVPFSILMSLGSALPRFTPAVSTNAVADVPALSIAVEQIAQPFTDEVFSSPSPDAPAAATNWTTVVLGSVWAIGVLALVAMRVRGWRRIRAALRASAPFAMAPLSRVRRADRSSVCGAADLEPGPPYAGIDVRSTPGLLEPAVVGLWRPILLLPSGIEQRLTPPQLDAVLAHELCHVQRRDNLTAAIHMVVEAAFWFHPLVWIVGARLVDERERACDEHVLRVCGAPQIYAESIVNVCKLYVESPLACVSGVGGSDLRKRVAAILGNRVGLQLSTARRVALAIAAAVAIVLPLAAGVLIGSAFPASAAGAAMSGQAATTFAVASVKPCEPAAAPEPGRRGPGGGAASPGYLHLPCMTLNGLVSISSGNSDDYLSSDLRNRPDGRFKSIRGGPPWASTDRFTIEARAEGAADRKALQGPMLRALLEERFQLKMHRATEDQPIYVMTVAAGGLKITPVAPDSCVEIDPEKALAGLSSGTGPVCGRFASRAPFKAFAAKIGKPAASGMALSNFLSAIMDRPVLDQTGLDGHYDVAFDYTPDDTTPKWESSFAHEPGYKAPPPPTGPNIFKALEQIGLKLEPRKWPVEYVVIDYAERPKPDDPSAIVERPLRAALFSDLRMGGGR